LKLLAKSLVEKIQRRKKASFKKSSGPMIYCARDLSISEALQVIQAGFRGIILSGGGKTSHAAIILRNYQIPAVFGVRDLLDKLQDGDQIALDGGKGSVVVNPTQETLKEFRSRKRAYESFTKGLLRLKDIIPKTKDGFEVTLLGNIDFEEEVEVLKKYGDYGIGLFRTEILYLTGRREESVQEDIYRKIADLVYPNEVTFRAFDLGGDKVLGGRETNPFLGLRGIRVLLFKRELLETQIRAVIKANVRGNIKFMIPMVSTVDEVVEARDVYESVYQRLKEEGLEVTRPTFGVMVETPSLALMVKEIAPWVDFISLGTNDLTQYTLAVDRRNPRVSYLYDHLHPAHLRLLKKVIEDAMEVNVPVCVCGEMASDPMGIPLLIGMGCREISVTPVSLLETKELIMGLKQGETEELVEECLKASTTKEVRDKVSQFLSKRFPHLVMFRPI
jgi:phosphotransferase system enzyme I (PtsI)